MKLAGLARSAETFALNPYLGPMDAKSQDISTFVRDLREAREYRKMSLNQIARDTKIQVEYLEALESGNWDRIGGPFLKGYLSSYADAVGMVREKVMKRFDELGYQLQPVSTGSTPRETPFQPLPGSPAQEDEGQGPLVPPLWTVLPRGVKALIFGVLIGLPLLLFTLLLLSFGGSDSPAMEGFESTLDQSRITSEERRQTLDEFAPFELEIRLSRPAALHVFSRDSIFFRGSLGSDSSLSLKSRSEVTIDTERLQELSVRRNGEELSLPADSGRAELRVSRQGIQAILRKL